MRSRTEGDDHFNPARRMVQPDILTPVFRDITERAQERNQGRRRRLPVPSLLERTERHHRAAEALLANILHSNVGRKRDTRYVLVPRAKAHWCSSRYLPDYVSPSVLELLDDLHDLGWIDQHQGYIKGTQRVRTSIGPTERLLKEYPDMTYDDFYRDEPEIIIMRKQVNEAYGSPKELVEYEETANHVSKRLQVREINEFLKAVDIWHPRSAVDTSDRQMVRIYTYGSLNSGGRLARAFWMKGKMSRKWRSEIRLDGEAVVELDYKCMNWSMLYNLAGLDLEGDAYAIPGVDLDREIIKKLMSAMLFHSKKTRQWPKDMDTGDLPPVGPIVAAILKRHAPVAHYLFKGRGIGHELQTLESDIIVTALTTCKGAMLPALPIHDCLLVPESRVEEAVNIMRHSYHQHLNKWPTVERKDA